VTDCYRSFLISYDWWQFFGLWWKTLPCTVPLWEQFSSWVLHPPPFYRRAFLDREFHDRWVGTGGHIPWHLRSPIFSHLWIFLRVCKIKYIFYRGRCKLWMNCVKESFRTAGCVTSEMFATNWPDNIVLTCVVSLMVPILGSTGHIRNFVRSSVWKSIDFSNTRVYPKVCGLAVWNENCKWYSSLSLGAVVSLFCESV
jgi:hypothetical protein